jgi:hypothetical protein
MAVMVIIVVIVLGMMFMADGACIGFLTAALLDFRNVPIAKSGH